MAGGIPNSPCSGKARAQSFLALCHYDDVNSTVNEFNQRYAGVGARLKDSLLKYDNDLPALFGIAKSAIWSPNSEMVCPVQ